MHKSLLVLLCLSLAGILLLSACNSSSVKTPAAVTASPTSTSVKSPTPALKATSTKVVKSTALATRTTKLTATPTMTQTLTAAQSAAEINSLLKTLVDDLSNTELVSETEIP